MQPASGTIYLRTGYNLLYFDGGKAITVKNNEVHDNDGKGNKADFNSYYIIGSGKRLDWRFDSNIYETWTDYRKMSKQDAHSRFDMLALPE